MSTDTAPDYAIPDEEPRLVDLNEVVDGQSPVEICGCGDWITEYDGEWLHVLNPALTGTDDHDAEPA